MRTPCLRLRPKKPRENYSRRRQRRALADEAWIGCQIWGEVYDSHRRDRCAHSPTIPPRQLVRTTGVGHTYGPSHLASAPPAERFLFLLVRGCQVRWLLSSRQSFSRMQRVPVPKFGGKSEKRPLIAERQVRCLLRWAA